MRIAYAAILPGEPWATAIRPFLRGLPKKDYHIHFAGLEKDTTVNLATFVSLLPGGWFTDEAIWMGIDWAASSATQGVMVWKSLFRDCIRGNRTWQQVGDRMVSRRQQHDENSPSHLRATFTPVFNGTSHWCHFTPVRKTKQS